MRETLKSYRPIDILVWFKGWMLAMPSVMSLLAYFCMYVIKLAATDVHAQTAEDPPSAQPKPPQGPNWPSRQAGPKLTMENIQGAPPVPESQLHETTRPARPPEPRGHSRPH